METIDRIECLACGQFRPPSTQQAECPLRGYLGWTLASALSERERAWYEMRLGCSLRLRASRA